MRIYVDIPDHKLAELKKLCAYIETIDGKALTVGGDIAMWAKESHGHWEKPKGEIKPFGDDTVQCSECGFFTEKDSTYIYNFCPVCGADMREAKGEKGTERCKSE